VPAFSFLPSFFLSALATFVSPDFRAPLEQIGGVAELQPEQREQMGCRASPITAPSPRWFKNALVSASRPLVPDPAPVVDPGDRLNRDRAKAGPTGFRQLAGHLQPTPQIADLTREGYH
jgi:hypothetical protein